MAAALRNILSNSNYGVPTGPQALQSNDVKTLSKDKFAKSIGEMDLVQINAEGEQIEVWKIKNPFFTSVQWGALDYGSDEIVECTVTVRYDWAELGNTANIAGNTANAGTGTEGAAPAITPAG